MLKHKVCRYSIEYADKYKGGSIRDPDPRASYDDASHWQEKKQYGNLAGLFVKNFEKFTDTQAGEDLEIRPTITQLTIIHRTFFQHEVYKLVV